MRGEAAPKIGRKQQETVEVFLLRQFRSFLPVVFLAKQTASYASY